MKNIDQHLKQVDPDRYLLSFFAGNDAQSALWVVDMFNYEIARLRENVTQPHVGMIRLAWWRERISDIYDGKGQETPDVLPIFSGVLQRFNICQGDVMDLMVAREQDFLAEPPFTLAHFFDYARMTHGPLLRIKSKVIGAKESSAVLDTLAASYAALGLVRAAPFHKQQGRVYLPELFASTVVPHNGAMIESVKSVCAKVSDNIADLTISSRYLKAHAAFVRLYLKHIAACGYDPFHLTPLPFLELRLWWAAGF